jgi:hypothetical protein
MKNVPMKMYIFGQPDLSSTVCLKGNRHFLVHVHRCYCYNHSYFMKCSKTLFCSSLNTGHGSSDAYFVFSTSIIYSKIKKNCNDYSVRASVWWKMFQWRCIYSGNQTSHQLCVWRVIDIFLYMYIIGQKKYLCFCNPLSIDLIKYMHQ